MKSSHYTPLLPIPLLIILNTGGYYDNLVAMLESCVSNGFMVERHLSMWAFVAEPDEVLPAILAAPEWNEDAINYAVPK